MDQRKSFKKKLQCNFEIFLLIKTKILGILTFISYGGLYLPETIQC